MHKAEELLTKIKEDHRLQERLNKAESVEEVLKAFHESGIEISEQELRSMAEESRSLSEEALNQVAGGVAMPSSEEAEDASKEIKVLPGTAMGRWWIFW